MPRASAADEGALAAPRTPTWDRKAPMRILTAVVAVAILAAGCEVRDEAALPEDHAAAIRDSVTDFLAAWSEGAGPGEWDRLGERYAEDPDFVWLEDGRVRYTSAEAVRAAFEGLRRGFTGVLTEFDDPRITPLAPGVAAVATRFRTTLRRDEGSPVRFGGAMTMTVLDTGDGWKVLQGHTSSGGRGRGGDRSGAR